MTGARLSTSVEPDRLVKTHCCFCGQQCGIQLKVRDNEVIGFEPWEDFPFNRGMLCPKGVKRYLQGSHPDRLLTAQRRDTVVGVGLQPRCRTTDAIDRVAAEIGRLQQTHGAGAIGVLGGASLTTEKTYLLGKFARVCLKTPFIDYNGRLCMVSAGAANKKAFGIDRTTNPWSDMVGTEVIWVAGSNVAECSPITTNYIWQAREQGAKIIVQDPRITPVARTCDLYLPVKPGRDAALFAGVLQIMIERDWLDHAFIDAHTVGFEQVAEYCREWTLARTADVTGVPQRAIDAGGRVVGHGEDELPLSRPRHRASLERRPELRSARSTSCSRQAGSASRRAATARSSVRPTGRAVASTGRSAISCRAGATSAIPIIAATSPASGASRRHELPGPGVDAYELFRKIDRGEIKGLLSICFNPKVSLPDNAFVTRCLEKLEFFAAIDFFLNDTARHADIVLPGSLHEEDEGTVTQVEGRIIKINKAVDCPGEAREDWRIIQDIARGARPPARLHVHRAARDLRGAAHRQQGRRRGLLRRHLREDRRSRWACSGRATARIPRPAPRCPIIRVRRGCSSRVATTRSPRAAGPFYFPDGRARFNVADYRAPVDDASDEYPIYLTTGRVVSQFLSGTQTRRIGPLVKQYPEPRIEMHPRLAAKLGIADGDWATAETRRGGITLKAQVVTTIRPDTIFIPYHWAGPKSANQLTVAAQDPISKIPQYKVCGCRVRKAEGPPDYAAVLEPQQ